MNKKNYVYVGNRFWVLKKMLELGCEVTHIFCTAGSFLQKELDKRGMAYDLVSSKTALIDQLKLLNYDYLVSSGCPYILPISSLSDGKKVFINTHPSLLPEFQGKHPVNGALLYRRDRIGVTCHLMDDGIDTGSVIAQIEFPLSEDLELPILYQLLFRAEGDAFELAYRRNFLPDNNLPQRIASYYTRSEEDQVITEDDSVEKILCKVRAFKLPGLYARYRRKNQMYSVLDAKVITNLYVNKVYEAVEDNRICILMDDANLMLVKWKGQLMELKMDRTISAAEGEKFMIFEGGYKNNIRLYLQLKHFSSIYNMDVA